MRVSCSLFVCCFFCCSLLLAACPDNETPSGEGEGEEGEGEGEEGEGEGEGEGETGCEISGCDDGQECGSVFVGGGTPACFANCDDGAAPCTTANGLTGECRVIDNFENPVCRAQAENFGACGNEVNSGCLEDAAVCVDFDDAILFPDGNAICVEPCSVDGDCGDAALGCSFDLQFRVSGQDGVRGVCAALTAVGSPCGLRESGLALCTSGLSCDRSAGESQGNCAE